MIPGAQGVCRCALSIGAGAHFALLRQDALVVDVGDRSGVFALDMALRFPNASIVVLQPLPREVAFIRWALRRNNVFQTSRHMDI